MKLNFRNVDGTRGSLSHGVTPLIIPSTTKGTSYPNQTASSQNHSPVNVATPGTSTYPDQHFQGTMHSPPRRCRSSLSTLIFYLFGVLVILTLPIALPVVVSHAVHIVDWSGGVPRFSKPSISIPFQAGYHGVNVSSQNHAPGQNELVSPKSIPVSASDAVAGVQPQIPDARIPPGDPAMIQSTHAVSSSIVQPAPHQQVEPPSTFNSFPSVMAHRKEEINPSASEVMGPNIVPPALHSSQHSIEKSFNHAADIARTAGYRPSRPPISQQPNGKSPSDASESVTSQDASSNIVAAYRNLQNGVFSNEGIGVGETDFVASKSLRAQHENGVSMQSASEIDGSESATSQPWKLQEQEGTRMKYAQHAPKSGEAESAQSNWMAVEKEGHNDSHVQGQMVDYLGKLGNVEAKRLNRSEWWNKRTEAAGRGRTDGVDEWNKYVVVRHGNLYLSETFEARLNEQVGWRIYKKHPEIFGGQGEGDCGGSAEVSFSFKASPRIRAELEIVTRCGHGRSSCTIKSEVDDLRRLHVNVGPGNGGEHFLRADGGAGSGGVWWGPLDGPLKVRLKESSMVVLRRVCGGERGFVWRVLSVGQIKQILREIEEVERNGKKEGERGESGLFDVFRYDAHPHEHIDRAAEKGL